MSGCIQFVCKCDKVVLGIASCLCGAKNNVLNLGRHIQSLKSALDEIKARHEGLWRNVQLEEMKGMKCRPEVRLWLSNYKKIVPRVNDLLNQEEAENQKLFFSGYCSKGYCSSWKYSADVRSMLVDVEKLHSKGVFTTVAESHVITKVKGIAIDQTISERKMVESTWSILMEDRVGTLGLYGIPGVGKTTLLSQINNEFLTKENDFYVVIWVVVPKDQNIQSMQEQIGRRLDIYDEEWIEKTENEKAFDIKRSLSKIRFALLLDDMLVKVNLRMLGVPPPDLKNKCKVAFTTRRKDVCRYMGAEEVKEVTRLDDNAAWVLFQEHVGEDMLRRNQGITAVAKIICEKCCGLPIVINAIGQTMAPKTTVGEWQDATNSLSSIIKESLPLAEFGEDTIPSILKFSYDNIEDTTVKSCFGYYALFPENYEIRKEELIEYWECEKLVVRQEGHRVFNILVTACLLMENEGKVKMHDMLRKMALPLIASDLGEQEGSVIVNTNTGLIQIPDSLNWSVSRWISLTNNQIKEISGSPSSPKLTTLLLRDQKVENISKDFFLQMPALLVLDLSLNEGLTHLPANISKLGSLRYLNLSGTNIKLLPVGLKELKLLICLNLEHTLMLQNIVGISALLKLRVLRLLGSAFCSNLNFVEELKRLEEISVLTICFNDEAVLKSFTGCQGLASHTQSLYIKDFATEADGISIAETSGCLQTLEISNSNIKEIKTDLLPPLGSPTSALFEKLCEVKLCNCTGLKHLTWLLFAPNLAILHVERAQGIEEILSKEKAEDAMRVQPDLTPFKKLKSLIFKDLRLLKSIYWSPLPFKCLNNILVQLCPSLKKLPLNSESAKEHKLVINAENEWIEKIDWEDDKTRDRFCRRR